MPDRDAWINVQPGTTPTHRLAREHIDWGVLGERIRRAAHLAVAKHLAIVPDSRDESYGSGGGMTPIDTPSPEAGAIRFHPVDHRGGFSA